MSESAAAGPRLEDAERGRRPYQPPRVAWEEGFRSATELLAYCGKADGGIEECNTNGLSS